MTSVLFVCLGNICRSPTAEGVLRAMCDERGLSETFFIDSAGTAGWHAGKPPDPRAVRAAAKRGIDLSPLRARQVTPEDFHKFDYMLTMDSQNYSDLAAIQPSNSRAQLLPLLTFAPPGSPQDVPDPYYGGDDGFELVLDLLIAASKEFIAQCCARED